MTAFSRYMKDAIFLIPTPQVLQKIGTGLEDLYINDLEGRDMQGDLYEYMLGKLATAGQNGQFRTPKHIREMMVKLADPKPKDRICDPACGTAGAVHASCRMAYFLVHQRLMWQYERHWWITQRLKQSYPCLQASLNHMQGFQQRC